MTKNRFLIIGLLLFLITWLFVGIFRDDEFNEPALFVKHTPSFKISFYSPTGMSDLKLADLSPEAQKEALAFEKFDPQNPEFQEKMAFLPITLIQLTLTFLSFGLIPSGRKNPNYWIQLPAHFFICNLLLMIILFFSLGFDRPFIYLISAILVPGLNYVIRRMVSGFTKVPD
jgi:hypothetical protein